MNWIRYILISIFSISGVYFTVLSIMSFIKLNELEKKIEGDSGLGGYAYLAGAWLYLIIGILLIIIAFLTYKKQTRKQL